MKKEKMVCRSVSVMKGSCFGFSGPSLVFSIHIYFSGLDWNFIELELKKIERLLFKSQELSDSGHIRNESSDLSSLSINAIKKLIFWTEKTLENQFFILNQSAKVRLNNLDVAAQACELTLYLPCHKDIEKWTANYVVWLIRLLDACFRSHEHQNALIEEHRDKHFAALKVQLPQGSNSKHFLKAAHSLSIPYIRLPGNIIQYGMGVNSIWLESSFSLETSVISSKLARVKTLTNHVLKRNGLPVAEQRLVQKIENLQSACEQLGFPLVIKPADLDGGVGVRVHLTDLSSAENAFIDCQKHSKSVLVESFVQGNDYRINVHKGSVLWIIERKRPQVTGDGVHTVRELIELINKQSQRTDYSGDRGMRKVIVDEPMLGVLKQQGVSLETCLEEGRTIILSFVANVSTGGVPVAITQGIHPDNVSLAINAANALRLDLAGVDLILPDISKSWLKTGGVICEVNAQPQLGIITQQHVYGQLLKRWIKRDGRIPVTCLIGGEDSKFYHKLMAELEGSRGVGWVDSSGARIDKNRLLPQGFFDLFQALFLNKSLEKIVAILPESILKTGLPVDMIDLLCVFEVDTSQVTRQLINQVSVYAKRVCMLDSCKQLNLSHSNLEMFSEDGLLSQIKNSH